LYQLNNERKDKRLCVVHTDCYMQRQCYQKSFVFKVGRWYFMCKCGIMGPWSDKIVKQESQPA